MAGFMNVIIQTALHKNMLVHNCMTECSTDFYKQFFITAYKQSIIV